MPDDFQKCQIPQILLRKTLSGNAGIGQAVRGSVVAVRVTVTKL
jgi:hypothetical protein